MKKIYAILVALSVFSTSCVEDDIYGACSIDDISNSLAYTDRDAVTVTASVTSLAGVKEAGLHYQVEGKQFVHVPMTLQQDGKTYSGTIPPQAMDAEVAFYIEARSKSDDVTTSTTVYYTVGAIPVNYDGLVLNELNGNDKFIELYNKGSEPIPMAGCRIFKDHDAEPNWVCGSIVLQPGAYLLLYSEDVVLGGEAQEGYDPALVFHSGLSAKKALCIELKNPADNLIDRFELVDKPAAPAPASYTRVPDGTGKWFHTDATPGRTNPDDRSDPVEGVSE